MELDRKIRFGKEAEVPPSDFMPLEPKDIIMRSENDKSTLYFYDNLSTDQLYTFIRYIAATNFLEFGSNDGNGEVVSARIDRGKRDWEFQDSIQILRQGRGVRFVTPSGNVADGNLTSGKYELVVGEGGELQLWSLNGTQDLNTLLWKAGQSGPRPEKRIPNTTQYTAVAEDATKYLVFENPVELIINSGVFAKDDELEGDCEGGDVTVTGSGVTILKLETQRAIILNNGPFGMRFKSGTKATLMGALKPL